MRAKTITLLAGAAVVLAGIAGGAVPGVAGAQPTPSAKAVAPNQTFVALVNDHSVRATVGVLCPGPLRLGQRGHPVDGQTVGVETPGSTASSVGFTGSLANSIVAAFPTPSASPVNTAVTFTAYGDQPIPSALLLPCYGKTTVVFAPHPTSKTARSARVVVTFVASCGSVVCPLSARSRAAR